MNNGLVQYTQGRCYSDCFLFTLNKSISPDCDSLASFEISFQS